jgi:hypothetical protein
LLVAAFAGIRRSREIKLTARLQMFLL